MTGDQRKIRTAGAKPVERDWQDALRRAWIEDAKAASARIERLEKAGGTGSSSNDAINQAMRQRNAALTIERRAKQQCNACGKLFKPIDLQAAPKGYGGRICHAPACWEKAQKWARSPA